jgi:hypothetical protein
MVVSLRRVTEIGERDWFSVQKGYPTERHVRAFRWPGYMQSYWVVGIEFLAFGWRLAFVHRTRSKK